MKNPQNNSNSNRVIRLKLLVLKENKFLKIIRINRIMIIGMMIIQNNNNNNKTNKIMIIGMKLIQNKNKNRLLLRKIIIKIKKKLLSNKLNVNMRFLNNFS